MSLEAEIENCGKIHDILAEHWNWAYYDTAHSDTSWLLAEYVNRLKSDIEDRVPTIINELTDILEDYKDESFSILDVGCGVGGFLKRTLTVMPEKFPLVAFKASGIDISDEMIVYARKNLHGLDVELFCESITDRALKFKNEPFDIAILMVTLSFYNDENAKEILCSIHDRLNEDGLIVVMDFAWSYKWSGFKLFSKPLQRLTDMFFSHLLGESFRFNNRNEEQLLALLNEAGFEVVKSYLSEKKSGMKGMQVIRARVK
ncbi:MAG: class I SAM-dependent methyltransferase [Candidatus Bathyarchaeota archaeon]|nr:MAG: class I SAM-dependent methyltransferase [Candidatus Bathyarchaeota archaeon]